MFESRDAPAWLRAFAQGARADRVGPAPVNFTRCAAANSLARSASSGRGATAPYDRFPVDMIGGHSFAIVTAEMDGGRPMGAGLCGDVAGRNQEPNRGSLMSDRQNTITAGEWRPGRVGHVASI
jgi:hypothetical protein